MRITNDCFVASLSGAAGTTLVADGCTVTLGGGTVSADGMSFETRNGGEFAISAGAGQTTVYGPSAIGSAIHAISGDLVFSALGISQKYLRWTFRKAKTSPNPVWLDRLWIFDMDGDLATPSMTMASDNAATLSAGQACWVYSSATNIARTADSQSYQTADRLATFVLGGKLSNYNNYFRCASPVVDPEDADSHLGIAMRLADDAKNVSGYNMMAPSKDRYPTSWTVEASYDGETWTVIDTHDDYVISPYSQYETYAWYDSVYTSAGTVNEHFKFSGYKSNGLAADASKPVALQVDVGASIDLTAFSAAPQKIGGIVIDLARGGGTVYGGALATGGVLTIKNAAQGYSAGSPLPLTLDGVADADNIAGWTVTIDGNQVQGTVKVRDGHIIVGELPTVILFH